MVLDQIHCRWRTLGKRCNTPVVCIILDALNTLEKNGKIKILPENICIQTIIEVRVITFNNDSVIGVDNSVCLVFNAIVV